ncbi:MAG: hypothetical protein KatS3mg027_0340 [Bacteroidia bacterium]|nr:MAG: hypothetical protein KatS3mg027_0340 [Bacteroidia bacterium]
MKRARLLLMCRLYGSVLYYRNPLINYKGRGALNALTSWTLNPGGTNPTNFTES